MECPSCSGTRHGKGPTVQTYICKACGCLHGTTYLGDSYNLVKPFFETAVVAPQSQRPFDLTCLGSAGITRRHGFYNPATRLVTQVG